MKDRKDKISILFPYQSEEDAPEYRAMDHETVHNLGLDSITPKLSNMESDRTYILHVLSHMTSDARVASYRSDVFGDILAHPDLRERIMEILGRINFLKDYGSFKRDHEEGASVFELMHRLEEINDYIVCVEAIHDCLSGTGICSQGLLDLKKYVDDIYADRAFAEMRQDIDALKADTSNLKSVTLGINLNERFEAESIGLVSINNKKFTKSNVIGNFSDAITARKGGVTDGNEWDENYRYQTFNATSQDIKASLENLGRVKIAASSPIGFLTMASIPAGDYTSDVTRYMDRIVNHMLFITVRKLKEVLGRYVNVTITDITDLIPEFMYYIRWAEYVERLRGAGYIFNKARVMRSPAVQDGAMNHEPAADTSGTGIPATEDRIHASARGIYNLLLAQAHMTEQLDIVRNDLNFDKEHALYILTGANRGGKTTITVAVGLLFVLAQGGIFIPGTAFDYVPVDCVYTHFPADEDKTMDLGRLGEECKRFRQIYENATGESLILLNETFSTTSFEEGYYIARDAVKAILTKGARTIYNTHMHKLARDIDEINDEAAQSIADQRKADGAYAGGSENDIGGSESTVVCKARSLIVRTDGGNRSFKIAVAPPEGMSYAEDIARKYGVTYEMLISPESMEEGTEN